MVDFDLRESTKGRKRAFFNNYVLLNDSCLGIKLLVEWVVDYFSQPLKHSNCTGVLPVTCTDKMPIILQYTGHSQVIIGFETSERGVVSLLTFDPSK